MFIPLWVAGAILAFMLAQFTGAVAWAIHADKRLALMEQSLTLMTTLLQSHNLAVLTLRIGNVENAVSENVSAHGRNRARIEELHKELYTLFGVHGSGSSSSPRSGA